MRGVYCFQSRSEGAEARVWAVLEAGRNKGSLPGPACPATKHLVADATAMRANRATSRAARLCTIAFGLAVVPWGLSKRRAESITPRRARQGLGRSRCWPGAWP